MTAALRRILGLGFNNRQRDSLCIILGAIEVPVQSSIVQLATQDVAGHSVEERLEVRSRRISQLDESWLGQQDGVPPVAAMPRETNLLRVRLGEINQLKQRSMTQVGLIAQNNRPVSQVSLPAGPESGALNGTEHAALRRWVFNTVARGKPQPRQFRADALVPGRANHADLGCSKGGPLFDQVAQN